MVSGLFRQETMKRTQDSEVKGKAHGQLDILGLGS